MTRITDGRIALALVLTTALLVRLAAGLWWQHHLPEGERFGFGDSESYWVLGQAIARGQPYVFGSPPRQCLRTPGYPAILAALFAMVGFHPPVVLARAFSAICGTLSVGGVYWLTRQLFGAREVLLAAILAAVYPGAVAMSALVLSEAPFSTLMLLELILWNYGWRAESNRRRDLYMTAAGVVAGLATLVRPSWLLFTPLAVIAGVTFSSARKRHLVAGAHLMLGLCLTMSPWWVRNFRLYGTFVPTTLQVGASLYDGLHPDADGSSDMRFVPSITEELRAADQDGAGDRVSPVGNNVPTAADAAFELRLDREFRRRALAWAGAHPTRAIQLAGIKLLRTWNAWPNEPSLRAIWLRGIVMLSYLPVVALAIVGAWRYCRRGWPYVLCLLPAAYFTLLHVVFVGSIRYRQPAMLTVIVLAAAVAANWKGRKKSFTHT